MKLLSQLPFWAWGLLIILYIVSPIDLIPDLFGFPGRLDDFLIVLGAAYWLQSRSKKKLREENPDRAGADKSPPKTEDPYKVLGVHSGQPLIEIQRKYREELLQYHPDRVQHLGRELQELAEQKTKDLNQAFQRILQEHRQKT